MDKISFNLFLFWKNSSLKRKFSGHYKIESTGDKTNPMQLFGSLVQSVLQRNRSQLSQPIGGVRARPLSRATMMSISSSNERPRVMTDTDAMV